MTFSVEAIDRRIVAYRCCMGTAVYRHTFYASRGKMELAKMHWQRALLLDWAIDVLCKYQREGMECNAQRASTYDEVCCAIRLADPCCVVKECVPSPPPNQPAPPSCEITPVYTVLDTVDVNERLLIEAAGPQVGDSYLTVTDSGGSGWMVNYVNTWNGTGWDSVELEVGQVVLVQSTGEYWVTRNYSLPGLLNPPVNAYLVAAVSQYVIQSATPQTAVGSSRQTVLRGFMGGNWVVIYQGPESALADPLIYNFSGLAITALDVVYTEPNGCQYTAGATVVPPFGECGTITATIVAERDCGTNEFFVIVDIQQVSGYPLGNIIATIDGNPQPPIPATMGVTLLGPYQTGDVVGVRITNAQDSECDFDAGNYQDPNIPVADRTVVSAVDASFQGSAAPGAAYLIVSDTTGAGNTWADHVGEYFNGAIFIPLVEGEVVQTQTETGFDKFWRRVNGLTVQMYPSVTMANAQAFPNPWAVVSNSPPSAATRYRPTMVEGLFGTTWHPIWGGLENELSTSQFVDISTYGSEPPSAVRVVYYGTQCPITVQGSLSDDDVVVEVSCDSVQYYTYQYVNNDTRTWLFSSPSGSVDILFVSGSMGSGTVMYAYDGTDNSAPLMLSLTGNFPDLSNSFGTGTSGSIFIEISAAPTGAEGQQPWIWGVMCTPSAIRPNGAVIPTDDCVEYEFSLDVDVFDTGDSPGGVIDVTYQVAGSPSVTIQDVGIEIINIGPFPYGSSVMVTLVHKSDPLANVMLGTFTSLGTCPSDPCIPTIFNRTEYAGDYADINTVVPSPVDGNSFFVIQNTSGSVPVPGSLLFYNGGTMTWDLNIVAPVGAYIFAGSVQGGLLSLGGTIFLQGNDGPINFFEPISVAANPTSTGPSDAWSISLSVIEDGSITSDRPIRLEVLSDGIWTEVWVGTEQQLLNGQNIEISIPFTLIRTTYNYDTCPVYASFYITQTPPLTTP